MTTSGAGSSTYSNAHSASWEALTAHFGLADIYRLHHGSKTGGNIHATATMAASPLELTGYTDLDSTHLGDGPL
jgi:H+/gluconate symporter-like permease